MVKQEFSTPAELLEFRATTAADQIAYTFLRIHTGREIIHNFPHFTPTNRPPNDHEYPLTTNVCNRDSGRP